MIITYSHAYVSVARTCEWQEDERPISHAMG